MTRYIKYPTEDGGIMLVEVEDSTEAMLSKGGAIRAGRPGETVKEAVEEVQTRFEDAMNVVRHNAQTIIGKVKGLSDPPDELEVTFGLKATGELGNFAVAKVGAEANYTVTMTWKREKEDKADDK